MALFLIGSLILTQITGISLFQMGDVSQWDASNPKTFVAIRGMLLLQFLGLFLIPSLLFAYFSDPQPAQYIGLKAPYKSGYWILGIAVMLIAIPFVEFTGMINKSIHFGKGIQGWAQSMEDEANKTIQFMLSDRSVSNLLFNIVFIAAFAGIGEELFFRGVLQRLLIKSTRSPWTGIILAAFFFSFFHFQFFGFIPRLLLGILLGAIYWYSGSIWPAILAHFVYDAFIIILVYFNPQMIQNPDASIVDKTYLGIGALVSLALVGGIIWWMKKNSEASYTAVYAGDDEDTPSENNFTF
jgi:membrane protease YdiL (CAAX protease family)